MSPLDNELNRVDSKAGARRNLPHLGTDQGKNAGGIATGDVAQRRWQHLPRLLQGSTSLLGGTGATGGNGPVYAGPYRALSQQAAHRPCRRGNAARRVKEDWQLALARVRQNCAQALHRAFVDPTFGRNPFAATRATGIGPTFG